jgi:parallel beta-helix repeat protein
MDKLPLRRIFLLSLSVLLAVDPLIRSVEANGTVYIRADGTTEGTDKILREGNVYTFTGNLYGPIVVEKDGIVIDGAGFSLQGTGIGAGINLMRREHVIVKKIEISNFFYGIYLNSSLSNTISNSNIQVNFGGIFLSASFNNTIIGCNITENGSSGVWLRCSSNNNIDGNSISGNDQDGIWLSASSNDNRISGNTVTKNGYGIRIDDYSNNMLRNNDLVDNGYNFGVLGSLLHEFIQDVDESNTVNGKNIYYWINKQDLTVPIDAGYVALINCSGVTVKNLNLSGNGQGLLIASTTESSIAQNNITDNIHGIYMCDSINNTVIWNNITRNAANGIYLYYSQNNTFFHNNFINNTTPIYDVGDPSNIWDSGAEGNHWSNYEERYPNAAELDGSGIWNTPYVLDRKNKDNYPLVNIIPEFPAWTILPLFFVATLIGVVIKSKFFHPT